MPKIIQINVTANWGSTGTIAEQIGICAQTHGWESYIAYGRIKNPSKNKLVKVGSIFDVYEHYAEGLILDNEGLASRRATKIFLGQLDKIKPDVVHLHNIHDHYINYKLLLSYLKEKNIPVVWTQHDCWAFTGGCMYYSMAGCNKWQTNCIECPVPRGIFKDKTNQQYKLRKKFILPIENFIFVPVSEWLENEIRKSFLRNKDIRTILNGVDLNVFKPSSSTAIRMKYGLGNKRFVIAVASVWSERKGLADYKKLATILDKDIMLVLVGLSSSQTKDLPENIIAVPRTQNITELAQLYTEASIVLNLSYEETFGLTTVEGFACGTPGIVYNCTASPELITDETGLIVDAGDIYDVNNAISYMLKKNKSEYSDKCRNRAVSVYDKDKSYEQYINLYDELLSRKK